MKLSKILTTSTILSMLLLASLGSFTLDVKSAVISNYLAIEPREPSTQGEIPYTATPGQLVTLNLTIQNAEEIYGYNISIKLSNQTVLEYEDLSINPFLEEPYKTNIYASGGTIRVYAESIPPANPVNGSAVLALLLFRAVAVGEVTFNFDVSDCKLIKKDGTAIPPSNFKKGKVAVSNSRISVIPEAVSCDVGQDFEVNVTVFEVTDIYGLEFKLSWNPDMMTLVQLLNYWPWSTKIVVKNQTGPSSYWLAISAQYPATSYNGSFTFATLTFNVTKAGFALLDLHDSKLGNSASKPIAHAEADSAFSNVNAQIALNPSEIIDASLVPGESFSVNVDIREGLGVKDFHVKVSFDTYVLNCSAVVFNDLLLESFNSSIDAVTGTIALQGSFYAEMVGNYSIASLTFTVLGFGAVKTSVLSSQSWLKNAEGSSLLFNAGSCSFINWRNVSITKLVMSDKAVIQDSVSINITVANNGALQETVALGISYTANVAVDDNSTTLSDSLYNTTLTLERVKSENSTKTISFDWNTTGLYPGDYIVTVDASVERDDFPSDNSFSKVVELVLALNDLRVTSIMIVPERIYVNDSVSVTIVLQNLGAMAKTFDLNVTLDGEEIASYENLTLPALTGDYKYLTLRLSEPGTHILNATVSATEGEVNLENNVQSKILNVREAGEAFSPYTLTLAIVGVVVVVVFLAGFILFKRRKA